MISSEPENWNTTLVKNLAQRINHEYFQEPGKVAKLLFEDDITREKSFQSARFNYYLEYFLLEATGWIRWELILREAGKNK